jgi:hypothetical protein
VDLIEIVLLVCFGLVEMLIGINIGLNWSAKAGTPSASANNRQPKMPL